MNTDFVVPTERLLNNLGPGCYVLIEEGGYSCWVEIDDCNGEVFWGHVHARLNENECPFEDQSQVAFLREHIANLGCDRYCFC